MNISADSVVPSARTQLNPTVDNSLSLLAMSLLTLQRRMVSFSEVHAVAFDVVLDAKLVLSCSGHNCVWHQRVPDWVANGTFTESEILSVVENHCGTLVGRYRGQV